MELFLNYPWPGNVRELENVIQRACILTQGSQITVQSLPPEMREPSMVEVDRTLWSPGLLNDFSISLSSKIERLTSQAEKELISRALARCGNRRQAAADLLGISRKSLHNKMVRYGMLDEENG